MITLLSSQLSRVHPGSPLAQPKSVEVTMVVSRETSGDLSKLKERQVTVGCAFQNLLLFLLYHVLPQRPG